MPNGNTVIGNWVNEWSKNAPPYEKTVQAIEVTPAKEIVWALREWSAPTNLGPATTIQFLDEDSKAEDVRFGDLR